MQSAKVTLHFCENCNNLLYPKADPGRRTMAYACRICENETFVDNALVYRNVLLTVTKCVALCSLFNTWAHV